MNESDLYREWPAPPHWRHAVACVWEQHVVADRIQRVVPDGHADLLLHRGGRIEVVGTADEVALPALPAGTRLVAVRLRPEAVGPAFETDASTLVNRTLAADDVLGARRSRLLLDPGRLDAWIRSIEPDRRVAVAADLLESCSVTATAERLGVTTRQLQRLMITNFGLAPKQYQRVVRFQKFLRIAEPGGSIAAAAAQAGYADQAHLTRDVGRLSGLTPAKLVAERSARASVADG